jgi:hypothetical protein
MLVGLTRVVTVLIGLRGVIRGLAVVRRPPTSDRRSDLPVLDGSRHDHRRAGVARP